MENLIKRSFSYIESLNSKISSGSYDILSPTGEIILPEIWESVIKPGWLVELRMWNTREAAEVVQENSDVGGLEMAPAMQSSSNPSKMSRVETSSDVVLATAKPRTSLKTWLGSRKSITSVAVG